MRMLACARTPGACAHCWGLRVRRWREGGGSARFLQAMMSSPVNNEGDRRTNTGSGVQTTALRTHTLTNAATHRPTPDMQICSTYADWNPVIKAYLRTVHGLHVWLLLPSSASLSPFPRRAWCRPNVPSSSSSPWSPKLRPFTAASSASTR